jgi:hypothetical protein
VSLAQQWRDFVCDPSRPGRFLSNIGRAVVEDQAPDIDSQVLVTFLDRLSGAGADVELLAAAVDLSHLPYLEFFEKVLPRLLDALASERVGENAIVGPGLRGNPDWSKTSVGRVSGKLARTHYATRLSARSFQLPENLLVRWLVGSVSTTIAMIEERVGSGAIPDRLVAIRTACVEAFAHHWFKQVQPPVVPAPHMFAAAKAQRNPAYRKAAQLAERRASRLASGSTARWLRTLDLLRANWLAPESTDDLFELYALTLVLDVLERDFSLGSPVEFGLAIPGRSHVALFDDPQIGKVRVFFDQSPHVVLGERSRYREIVSAHSGALGAARRPDVTVARYAPGTTKPTVLFLEVKESRDTVYTSDSIYKAMGYAFDYSSLWDVGPPCPKVVLIFPEDIGRRAGANVASLDVTLVSSLDRAAIVEAMRARLDIM